MLVNIPFSPLRHVGHLSASRAEQLLRSSQNFKRGKKVNQWQLSLELQRSRHSNSSETVSASTWKLSMHSPLWKQSSVWTLPATEKQEEFNFFSIAWYHCGLSLYHKTHDPKNWKMFLWTLVKEERYYFPDIITLSSVGSES